MTGGGLIPWRLEALLKSWHTQEPAELRGIEKGSTTEESKTA